MKVDRALGRRGRRAVPARPASSCRRPGNVAIIGNVGGRPRGARPARLARPRQHPLRPGGPRRRGARLGAGRTRPGTRSRPSAELGGEAWFRLGDRDLGLHLVRTAAAARRACRSRRSPRGSPRASGSAARCCPRPTSRCARSSRRRPGTFPFQEWFVARGHRDEVDALHYAGAPEARPAPGVLEAIERRRPDRDRPEQSLRLDRADPRRRGDPRGARAPHASRASRSAR